MLRRRPGVERRALRERLKAAGVSSIEVDRPGNKLRITIQTSRPGIIIGRKGAEIEKLKQRPGEEAPSREIFIDIQEVHEAGTSTPSWSASPSRCSLEKRVAFRRAMRKSSGFGASVWAARVLRSAYSGRLNGAEIARTEWYFARPAAAAHVARRHRLRVHRGAHDLRCDRRIKVLGVQGRNSPRGQLPRVVAMIPNRAARRRGDRGERGDRGDRRDRRGPRQRWF